MDVKEALQIVYDLADQNALDIDTCGAELREEAEKQAEALRVVHDMAVNQFGDD